MATRKSGPTTTCLLLALLMSCVPSIIVKCPNRCRCSVVSPMKLEVHCEKKNFDQIPDDIPLNVTHLYLDGNKITGLPDKGFAQFARLQELHLNNNMLQSDLIQPGAFLGLKALKRLFLTQNKLTLIKYGLFQELISLERMYFSQNMLSEIPDLSNCTSLFKLLIDNNYLKDAQFPKGYSALIHLTTLQLTNNQIKQVSSSDMQPLINSNIQAIYLSRNPLESVSPGAFSMFPQLKAVTLAYLSPNLNVTFVRNILNDLGRCRYLVKLDLSNTIQDTVPSDLFSKMNQSPLTTLDMTHMSGVNTIENGTFIHLHKLGYLDLSNSKDLAIVENGAFFTRNTQLTRLDLSSCRLSFIPRYLPSSLTALYLSKNKYIDNIKPGDLDGLTSLTTLDVSHCVICLVNNDAFISLTNLTSLDLSYNQLSGTTLGIHVLEPLSKLQKLNLKGNRMTQIVSESRLFAQQTSLESLDFSDNQCRVLPKDIFHPLRSLKSLDLSGNFLGQLISEEDGTLFRETTKLEYLYIQRNELSYLPGNLVKYLHDLKTLLLFTNSISQWGTGFFNGTSSLSLIDMSYNRIAVVNSSSVEGLPHHVKLNLSGNPFNCWCDLIWFRNWMSEILNSSDVVLLGASSYKCLSPKSMNQKRVLDFHPEDIHAQCYPPPWMYIVIGSSAAAAGVIIIIVSLMYRYRWPIRLRMYNCGKSCRGKPRGRLGYEPIPGEDAESQHDVFVSYGPTEQDAEWVKQMLIPQIDKDRGGKWKVLFEEKTLPNSGLIGQIAEMIEQSRKIMLVISKEYLTDSRRAFEMELAIDELLERRNTRLADALILVILDERVMVKIPSLLHPLIHEGEHLVWTQDESGRELFWQKVEEKISADFHGINHAIQA